MRLCARLLGVLVALATGAGLAPSAAAAPYRDPLLPGYGDTAIDMRDYRVDLAWDPTTNAIEATARIVLRTTTVTGSIVLDLEGLTVDAVEIEGSPATFARSGHRLTIGFPAPVGAGTRYTVEIRYHGVPETYVDPDGALEGWARTKDGALALGEPIGTMTWLPISNVPADKTRLAVRVTVPRRFVVASNGRQVAVRDDGPTRTWAYRSSTLAPYLAMVAIGRFQVYRGRTGDGVRLLSFVDPAAGRLLHQVRLVPTALRWLARRIGTPYPFLQAGIVVDPNKFGYALETQTRPVFPHPPGDLTVVHELAHQWFGDSVTPRQWDDLWLNEGFATYLEWCWLVREGRGSPAEEFARRYRGHRGDPEWWTPTPHRLGDAAKLFSYRVVYLRAAMTLQALRERVGGPAFWRIVRAWTRGHADGNGTTEQFEALAERVSGRDLDRLFRDWLDRPVRPVGYGSNANRASGTQGPPA